MPGREFGELLSPDGSQFIQHVSGAFKAPSGEEPRLIGVLEGEGIGPDVVRRSLDVLKAVSDVAGIDFVIEHGGAIGKESVSRCGRALSDEVVAFCESIFARRGALLTGAGGGRFVYDLRRRFDLFCKVVPIRSEPNLDGVAIGHQSRDVDILLIRENTGGIYQGTWSVGEGPGGRTATHSFEYSEHQVRRILQAAARIAGTRDGRLTVVWKEAGIPSISKLWQECAREVCDEYGILWDMIDVDLASYLVLAEPDRFDVVVAPNLFGDVLGDLAAILSGSRGMSFSGNYDPLGHGVYQTNHGAAFDLTGTDQANPVGQILSVAMMLRESFGLAYEAALIERGVRDVWRDGWRTFDLSSNGSRIVGTRKMAELIRQRIEQSPMGVPGQ